MKQKCANNNKLSLLYWRLFLDLLFLKSIIHILFVLSSLSVFSQEYDKKAISTTSKLVLVEFASVEHIELEMNENSNEIAIQFKNADVQNTPIISDDGTSVLISVSKNAMALKGIDKNKYRAGQPLYPSYILSIPKGLKVQLLYDKGSFATRNFYGNLELHLNSGEVTINQFKGLMNIVSFSGKINCNVNAAKLEITASKGTITSNLKDKRLLKTQTSLNGIFKNANNVLKIKTIHAKVNLKSMSTQK